MKNKVLDPDVTSGERFLSGIMSPVSDSDILKIVKEDILRILGQAKGGKASLEAIDAELKVSDQFISEAAAGLRKAGLIRSQKSLFTLTVRGREKAQFVVERHLVIENYFKKTRSAREAHKAAHILEHYVSQEVLNNIKKLSTFKRQENIPLTKFRLNEKGLISDITLVASLFERVVSMGVCPGERVVVTNTIPGGVIIKVGDKKLALGKDVAKRVKVLTYEKA